MDKLPLSVVVLTKNEESNIGACLESINSWADEIVVVDDESTDRTVDIAQGFTERIYHRKTDTEGRQRNWAYSKASHEWVLSLDADETVTDELREEIRKILPGTQFHGFSIPRRNYIGDYWVKYGGQYPAAQLKLFQKNRFRYEEVGVHPRVFLEGETGTLTKDIIHKSYRDFEHFFSKMNKQTTLEAQKWILTGQNMTTGRIIRRSIDRFLRSFIRKKGFKDGFIGFMVAYFASLYQVMSYAKYWEMLRRPVPMRIGTEGRSPDPDPSSGSGKIED